MIKLELDPKKAKPLYIMRKKGHKQGETGSTKKDSKESLTDKLSKRIIAHLEKKPSLAYAQNNDAFEIVSNFLTEYFADYLTREKIEKRENKKTITQAELEEIIATNDVILCNYLLPDNLTKIITFFWHCVADKWTKKLSNAGTVVTLNNDDIDKLSKWSGVKQHIEKIPTTDCNLRQHKIREAMPESLRHFFVYDFGGNKETDITDYDQFIQTVAKDNKVFKTVKFKYHTDLSTPEGKKLSKKKPSNIWGALDILSYIFNYGWFTETSTLYGSTLRHKILSSITAPVCPYCNRQYITLFEEGADNTTVDVNEEKNENPSTQSENQNSSDELKDKISREEPNATNAGDIGKTLDNSDKSKDENEDNNLEDNSKTTADLDHFYIKSGYPFLALSVHNFIPSCQICNSRFKRTTDFHALPHLYPYGDISGSEITFELTNPLSQYDIETWETKRWRAWDGKQHEQIIKVTPAPGNEGAKNSVDTFHLEEVYKSHADYVQEIVWKRTQYPDEKIRELVTMFPGLFSDEEVEEAKEMIFGQYLQEDKLYKRPLAKLTKDILISLDAYRNK